MNSLFMGYCSIKQFGGMNTFVRVSPINRIHPLNNAVPEKIKGAVGRHYDPNPVTFEWRRTQKAVAFNWSGTLSEESPQRSFRSEIKLDLWHFSGVDSSD